jgi:hypothetical protein
MIRLGWRRFGSGRRYCHDHHSDHPRVVCLALSLVAWRNWNIFCRARYRMRDLRIFTCARDKAQRRQMAQEGAFMNCIQSECMNRTTGCFGYGECQARRLQREKFNCVAVAGQAPNALAFTPMAQQGWECPRCKTIHSPHVPMCMCRKPPKIDYTQGAGGPTSGEGSS